VFDPKNRIHWLAVIVIAIILILVLGVTSAWGQEPPGVMDLTNRNPGPCGEVPAYMPRDIEPRIVDPAAVREHLVALQESEGPDAGGRVVLWVCVARTGQAASILIHTTSGDPVLDTIALRVIAATRYSPARNGDQPTTVWIAQPVDFIPRSKSVEL